MISLEKMLPGNAENIPPKQNAVQEKEWQPVAESDRKLIPPDWDQMFVNGLWWTRPPEQQKQSQPLQPLQLSAQAPPWPGCVQMTPGGGLKTPNGSQVVLPQTPTDSRALPAGVPNLPLPPGGPPQNVPPPSPAPPGAPGIPAPLAPTPAASGRRWQRKRKTSPRPFGDAPGCNTFQVWSPEPSKEETAESTGEKPGQEAYYRMVDTPKGPALLPVSGGKAFTTPATGSREDGRTPDNSRVVLPWYLYRDGFRRTDNTEMGYLEWESRLKGWRAEHKSGIQPGVKALNGITDAELWKAVERQGLEQLQGEDGLTVLATRVKIELQSKGVYLQEEYSKAYWQAPRRLRGERMTTFMNGMNDRRKRLAESLGLEEGQEALAINDRLHGLQVLEKARISKLEQRQVQRQNLKTHPEADESMRFDLIVKDLTTMYFDIHTEEGGSGTTRSRPRPRKFGNRRAQAYVAAHGGEDTPSASSEQSGTEGSSKSEDSQGSEKEGDARQSYVAEENQEGDHSDGESKTSSISMASEEVDGLSYADFEAYVGYKSAKQVVNEYKQKRGFEHDAPKPRDNRRDDRRQSRRSRPRRQSSRRGDRGDSRRGRTEHRNSSSSRRKGSRPRSSSRPGEKGNCAICGEPGHWKNERPQRGSALDKGPKPPSRPPSIPSSRPPSKPTSREPSRERRKSGDKRGKKRNSFFAQLLLPAAILNCACYMAETCMVDSPEASPFEKHNWWNRMENKCPEFAERWKKENHSRGKRVTELFCAENGTRKEVLERINELGKVSRPPGRELERDLRGVQASFSRDLPGPNIANLPHRWQAFSSECDPGSGAMDSACNKSMIGEHTLNAQAKYLRKRFGLCIYRYAVKDGDTFKFGDAEVKQVKEMAVRPIAILNRCGEILLSVIPKADTPLLVAKDDLGALGVFLGFGIHKAIISNLSGEVMHLRQTPSGHYELPLNQFPPEGHSTPYTEYGGKTAGFVNGPSLTIYQDTHTPDSSFRCSQPLPLGSSLGIRSKGSFQDACDNLSLDGSAALLAEGDAEDSDGVPPLTSDSSDSATGKVRGDEKGGVASSSESEPESDSESDQEDVTTLV